MNRTPRILALMGAAATASFFSGCANEGVPAPSGVPVTEMGPDQRGFVGGTGIESQDLVTVTDKMARSILAVPEIANAKTTPHIVLNPVLNNTRFPIDKDIFLTRIRVMLNSRAMNRIRFLDRPMMATLINERVMEKSGQLIAPSDPNVVQLRGADFFLAGQLDGMTTKTSAGTGDYVLYSFHLTDARTSEIVWEDSYEIKKEGLEDAAYR